MSDQSLPSPPSNNEQLLDQHPSDAEFYNEEYTDEATAAPLPRSHAKKSSRRKPRKIKASRAASSAKNTKYAPINTLRYEIIGLLLIAFSGILLFNALRPSAEGWLPRLGVGAMRYLFGMGTPVILFLLLIIGASFMWRNERFDIKRFGNICSVILLLLLTAVHLYVPKGQEFAHSALIEGGGIIGASVAWILRRALGQWGAFAAIVVASIIAVFHTLQLSIAEAASKLGESLRRGINHLPQEPLNRAKSTFSNPFVRTSAAPKRGRNIPEETPWDKEDATSKPTHRPVAPMDISATKTPRSPFIAIQDLLGDEEENGSHNSIPNNHLNGNGTTPIPTDDFHEDFSENAHSVSLNAVEDENTLTPQEALAVQAEASAPKNDVTPSSSRQQLPRKRVGDGPLLPFYFDDVINAMDPPVPVRNEDNQEDIAEGARQVEETLAAFRIDAHVTGVKRGPVITRYEVRPAAGVRVASIANLDRDLARALSAIAVRIEAPVPGRNVVGIEVPNKKVQLVRLRDVLDLPEFLSAPSKLAFALGKDIAGQAKWANLTKMPHMLIAGATNSGKSVCLNSIIASIICRAGPEEVKLSLIDPKRVELTLYHGIPHLYHPVVVEPKDAVRALRGAIVEMERRYKLFAERGVRNIASYNKKYHDDEMLPYIVIIIDELADLMMTAAAEFEKLICRLAQLARATGIHLIVATQRPSVNVITGVIKANIPARIAFAVASQVDSRTILDSVGAERLIGSGDMLFDANNGGKSVRIQGAFLSEEEVNHIVEAVKEHYADSEEEYNYGLDLAQIDGETSHSNSGNSLDSDKRDSIYDDVKDFVLQYDEMSASLIQRKFGIGYPRAGRIVDQLEQDGILGPPDGPKPRKVLGGGG